MLYCHAIEADDGCTDRCTRCSSPALQAVRPFQRFLPLFYVSMFSTISGNLLLARSKPPVCNCIGFWYSFGTDRFANCSAACLAGILSLVVTPTHFRAPPTPFCLPAFKSH